MRGARGTDAGLAVVETHPIQYHAPLYRMLQQTHGIPVTAIYGSDFSVAGYRDTEFMAEFAWDTDLLSGYRSVFLSTVSNGGARTADAASSRGAGRAIREIGPRAVLLVGYSPSFHQWAWLQAWQAGCPILFRGETANAAQTKSPLRAGLRRALLQRLYRSCEKLLYIGEWSRRHYENHGCPANQLIFSPYCVDTAPFQTDEDSRLAHRTRTRLALGISENEIVLLFSGKLSYRKGPDLLVSAARILPQEIRDRIVILFVGSGELQAELATAAQAAPQIQTRFAGFQNQKQLSPYYHAADLLVLPSRYAETWGLVVNEALHHGLPCVASKSVGCVPDLVTAGETGEVFETGSVEGLAGAIGRAARLVGSPEIRDRCRKRVAGYTTERAAQGIADAYYAATS